jgi:hypothetical protein
MTQLRPSTSYDGRLGRPIAPSFQKQPFQKQPWGKHRLKIPKPRIGTAHTHSGYHFQSPSAIRAHVHPAGCTWGASARQNRNWGWGSSSPHGHCSDGLHPSPPFLFVCGMPGSPQVDVGGHRSTEPLQNLPPAPSQMGHIIFFSPLLVSLAGEDSCETKWWISAQSFDFVQPEQW